MNNNQFYKWNIITNICMALSINTAATILAGGDTLAGWVTGCCQAFAINTVASIIIPVGIIGNWFAQNICHTKEGQFTEVLARNFIINAIYVTIVSFSIAMIHVGMNQSLIPVWLSTYFQLHIVGFITGIIIEKPVMKMVSKL